jgi:serine/threonine-protein kinase
MPSLFLFFLVAGWLFAAFFLFPAPFLTASRTVPQVIGSERENAEQVVESAGFSVGRVEGESHPTVPRGVIIWQDPAADVVAPEGRGVELVVSTGPQQIPVPDVIGYEGGLARQIIEASGLTIARVESVQTAVPKDVAVSTRPTAGATLSPGARVTLVLSLGAPTIRVPQLAGLTIEQAQDSLMAVGLTLGTFWRETSSANPEGTVLRTEPPIGTLTAPETAVNIVVVR